MTEPFDLDALVLFLADVDPALAAVDDATLELFKGGASNLTARVQLGGRRLVVRRAPPGRKAATAHDMVREAKLLTTIRPHFPLVPKVIAVGEDPSVLGTPFFVMEHLEGKIPRREMPAEVSEAQARRLCENLVALHADLHAIDLVATGLESLGKPTGYVARQISGWTDRYRAARTDDVPSFDGVIAWLERHQPPESGAALIHNDFKLDNVVLDPDDLTRIVGVLDWEMATVGDPLMDLGASLAYWVEQGDSEPMKAIRLLPTTTAGMMTRAQVVAHYAARSGRTIDDFTYYYVYGLFRLAGIAQQIYKRYKLGQTSDERFAMIGMAVAVLSAQAEQVIERAEV